MNKSLQDLLKEAVDAQYAHYYEIMGIDKDVPAAWEYKVGDKKFLEFTKLDHYYIHKGEYVKGIPLYYRN